MITNKMAIKENGFMSDEKLALLVVMTTLKKLGENGQIIDEILDRSKREKGKMLDGLAEKLVPIRNKFSEESFGFESIQALINELNGGAHNDNG